MPLDVLIFVCATPSCPAYQFGLARVHKLAPAYQV